MDAACVLEKTRGAKIMHIFVKIGGEEKLRGEERLNYLNTFALCSYYFLKNFLARSLTFYFHPPFRGHGTYTAGTVKSVSLLKVGRKASHLPDVTKLITQNLN